MIARAARQGLRVREVPVTYRKRAGGESKVERQFLRLTAGGSPNHGDDSALPRRWDGRDDQRPP